MYRLLRWMIVTAALVAAGCAGKPQSNPPTHGTAAGTGPEEVRYPLVQPVLLMPGRIVSVRDRLRFVVVDFGINPLPVPGTVMEVRRDGAMVGKLRVSGPDSGSRTIADLVDGEAAPGDAACPVHAAE